MRIKRLRLFSALLAILICFSAFPLGVFADSTEGDSWGGKTTGGSSSGNISSGQAFYNNTISGVRIYLSSDLLVSTNRYKKTSSGGYTRSSAGDYVFFGKVNNGAVLDTYKRYAIYEISDNGGSGTSMISYLKNGSKTLKGLWKMNGSWYDNTAFYLDPGSVNSDSHSVNTNPDFAKLIKGMSNAKDSKGNYRSYKAWFRESNGSSVFDFSSLSNWAHDIFANAKTEDLNKFLENYYNLLIDDFGIKASNLAEFPRTASDFISDGYCIVVEPVMISGKNNVTDAPYYAWSAQDFYRDLNLGSHFRGETSTGYFGKFAVAMKESFCIDYTSNKYNKNWSPSGKVSTKLGTSVPSGFPEANKAGGFAFYYSSDVVAQDVPVQVANTVVVDVGAPKYINGETSAESLPPVGSMR